MQKRMVVLKCIAMRALAVFLSVSMASSNTIQVELVPPMPLVNQTVLFNVSGISDSILFSEWYRGNETSADNQIIRYNNNDNSKNEGKRRIPTANIFANGSLEIQKITKDLADRYTVFIQGGTTPYQSTVLLKVYDPNSDHANLGLSGGAIAGIVIGVLAVVTAAIVGGVYAFKSKDSG